MIARLALAALVALTLTLSVSGTAQATQPVWTSIEIKDLHCKSCANKVASKLYALKNVDKVGANVEKNMAYVLPKGQAKLSPRALWAAVVESGFTPVRLSGPSGVFTKQPGS